MTQSPAWRGSGRALLLAGLVGLVGCGGEPAPTPAPAIVPSSSGLHPGETTVTAVLVAIDGADPAAFAAQCADPADPRVAPLAAADVATAMTRLHQTFGQRARRVSYDLVAAQERPIEVEATVDIESGAASLVFTLREAPDGVWRVVGWSEAEAPMRSDEGEPVPGGTPTPH